MRDGIYKNLPMPRRWKSLLKACLREAERGDTAAHAAYKAVNADAKREISEEFLKRLRRIAEQNQLNLPGLESDGLASFASIDATPHERRIAQHVQRLRSCGVGGAELMRRALADGLADMRIQQLRQVEQHVYLDGGPGAREVMTAVHAACNGVTEQVAAEFCGTARKNAAARMRKKIDPDEDLAARP